MTDEEGVLSESVVKLRNEVNYWKKKVGNLEEVITKKDKDMDKTKDDNYYLVNRLKNLKNIK